MGASARYKALCQLAVDVRQQMAHPLGKSDVGCDCFACRAFRILSMTDDQPPAATGRVVRFAVAFDKAGNWSIYGARGIPRRDMLGWAVSQVGVEAETRMATLRLPEPDDLVAEIET